MFIRLTGMAARSHHRFSGAIAENHETLTGVAAVSNKVRRERQR